MTFRETSDWKENYHDGRDFYNNQQYENALSSYQAALISTNPRPPESEKPILLSNAVACRLKIGGQLQYEAALAEALECVSLNPRWSKGHVRLASVYICLQRSNDACNSLQRAISLDPSNQNARSMLMKELRRDNQQSSNNSSRVDPFANASAPPPPSSGNTSSSASSSNTQGNTNDGNSGFTNANSNSNNQANAYPDIDDLPSVWERYTQKMFLYMYRIKEMYINSNDDTKSFIKALLVILCLYVAFGGKFGLDSIVDTSTPVAKRTVRPIYDNSEANYAYDGSPRTTSSTSYSSPSRGNYGRGNAYDQYYESSRRRSSYYDNEDYYSSPYTSSYSSSSSSYSYHFPNLLDGGIITILLVFGIVYLIKRFGGVRINPWHALWMLRMMNRGGMGGYRYGRGMGMGMGMGRGMGGYGRRQGYRRGFYY